MVRPYRHIIVEQKQDVHCVHLRQTRMDETDILDMADELAGLINDYSCRKLAFSLGPQQIECLYSVFLAKMVMVRRLMAEHDGRLKICDATTETLGVFDACHLKEYFDFVPDQATALAELAQ